jgi:hypothetical protein
MNVLKLSSIVVFLGLAISPAQPLMAQDSVRFYLPSERKPAHPTTGEADATIISVSPPATASLNGEWDFYYDGVTEAKKRGVSAAQKEPIPDLPTPESYEATMPVPGYWDDHLTRLQTTSWWFWAQFNSNIRKIEYPMGGKYVPPFANLPYLVGTGYYRKFLHIPEQWVQQKLILSIGGVVAEADVYLNGARVAKKSDYLTPADVDLSGKVRAGKNELIIAVTNRDTYQRGSPTSCAIDGYHGFTGGIYGEVSLRICSKPRINDLFVFAVTDKLRWRAEAEGAAPGDSLRWAIFDDDGQREVLKGELPLKGDGVVEWDSASTQLEKWSERNPKLYVLDVKSVSGGQIKDHRRQNFGLRTLATRDRSIFMNGKSLMLRGICDSWYYPRTTTSPLDPAEYVEMIRKYKQLGFNWIRFHSAMPRQEYLDAADKLGMLIQVESPRGSDEQTWNNILRAARNHPSVILYCVSNEALMDEEMIAGVVKRQQLMKQHVPDALFSPMQALRGVEYGAGREDFGPDAVDQPFLHNPRRLKILKDVADVIQPTGFGHFSFQSAKAASAADIDAKLDLFERPCLLHEVGIHGTYLDLQLTDRYRGSRIGTDLYDSIRRYLQANGLESKADLYYRNSCRWAQLLRKHAVERARLCENVKGYDLLGAVDIHWLFCGYTCGIMNEFLELKPGESVQDVLNYNGESVLLTDLDTRRVFVAGESIKPRLFASLFGDEPSRQASLYWNVTDDSGRILKSATIPVGELAAGKLSSLTEIPLQLPDVRAGVRLQINAKLLGANYDLANRWSVWVFPRVDLSTMAIDADPETVGRLNLPADPAGAVKADNSLRVASKLTSELIEYMKSGGRVLLLGSAPFKTAPTSFQVAAAGRVIGNQATVIAEHPIFSEFPHEGFCDWQFYQMLNDGNAIVFDDPRIPFEPVLEIASSYKLLKKQAAIFELAVGNGALLVCSLNLNADDPAGRYLMYKLVKYGSGGQFKPRNQVGPDVLEPMLK